MWKHSFAAAIISLTVSIPFSYAQETQTGAVTGSGAYTDTQTIQEIVQDARYWAKPTKNPTKLKDVIVPELKEKAWLNESATTRKRQAEHQVECREAIRRANRDELMTRARQCYRSDLLLEVTMLRNQLQYITSIPNIDSIVRDTVTGAILKQIDAEMAIVDAIDTGIFIDISQLEETKRNLTSTYRQPTWLALTHLRADRELTWIVYMLKNIEERADFSDTESNNAILLKGIAVCLETAAYELSLTVAAKDLPTATIKFTGARNQVSLCRQKIDNLAQHDRSEVSQKTDNDSSQQ